ncbi:hypothetical protein K402DRAFT_11778 [Aulographum hederae CBS 113979]|uniref:Uncharacterized protein n=1 Tax=Aulographum hederae CBS 113979 TaxID=1176131 RepID=A0A6G1H7G0_9PEZI|nr:hypothetical protein K402DRAFT_11778 [Aulographum hederae CBS 113979]
MEQETTKVRVDILSPDHLSIFRLTLSRILESDVAKRAYAQILDGWPAMGSFMYGGGPRELHETISEEAFQALEALQSQFRLDSLSFDPPVAQGYQDAPLGSEAFKTHLIELLAISCHDVGACLFQQAGGGLRPTVLKPLPDWMLERLHPVPSPPTCFVHAGYSNLEEYPNGVGDIVGYWVENQIFGGVVVFDRGESGTEVP